MKKEYRIRKNEDFGKIISKKTSLANQSFIIYYTKNDISHIRVGISVSKKLGNAVVRNKIKRQVRSLVNETFNFEDNIDFIIIVRNKYLQLSYEENKKEIKYVYQKTIKRMGK